MTDLRSQPEIKDSHRDLPQILTGDSYVHNIRIAADVFKNSENEDHLVRAVNELCAYVRLIGEKKIDLHPRHPIAYT